MRKKNLLNILYALLFLAVLYSLGREFWHSWSQIRSYAFHFNIPILIAACLAYAASFVVLTLGWNLILEYLKSPMPFLDTLLYFCITQPAKYIPGKIWLAVTRMKFCKKHDVPNSITLLSTGIEGAMEIFAGAYISLIAILQIGALGRFSLWGTVVITILGIAILYPPIFYFWVNLFLRIVKRDHFPKEHRVSFGKLLALQVIYIFAVFIMAISQLLFLQSFAPVSADLFPMIVGISAFTFVASILAVFTPGGLGVREGIWFLALKKIMVKHVALIYAFVSRIWIIILELILMFLSLFALWLKHRKHKE